MRRQAPSSLQQWLCSNRSGEPGEGGADGRQDRDQPENGDRRGARCCAPLLLPGRVRAQGTAALDDNFVVLLKGLYQPVVRGPNLGLSAVDLDDGSYSTTKIYPVSGTPGNTNVNKAIGDFYAQFDGELCAYHIPGGSFAMRFDFESDFPFVADGGSATSCTEPGSLT